MTDERTMQIPATTRRAMLDMLIAVEESGIWRAHPDVRAATRKLSAEPVDQRQFGPAIDVTDPSAVKTGSWRTE